MNSFSFMYKKSLIFSDQGFSHTIRNLQRLYIIVQVQCRFMYWDWSPGSNWGKFWRMKLEHFKFSILEVSQFDSTCLSHPFSLNSFSTLYALRAPTHSAISPYYFTVMKDVCFLLFAFHLCQCVWLIFCDAARFPFGTVPLSNMSH